MRDLATATHPYAVTETAATNGCAETAVVVAVATAVEPAPVRSDAPAALRWWVRLAWYAGAILLTCLLVAGGLRLDRADLRAPFYYNLDALLILPMVKSTTERGFGGHWHIDRLSAPDGLDLHDYPVIDHLHFLILWLLGLVVPDLFLLFNLYFLLTFPLTTLTAMVVFRHLRLSLPAAAVGALLFAFLPYHYQRWENHYFLAAYWLTPISLLPVFAILQGNFPFFRNRADATCELHLRSWTTAAQVLLGAATASAGAYYAFFTCVFAAFAGIYAGIAFRKWQAAASAAGVVALIVLFGVINHYPTYLYQAKYDRNPITERFPDEADSYGLKIAHLFMPIEDHRVSVLARLKWFYNSPGRVAQNENRSASLGVVGAAGLLLLIAVFVTPNRWDWPYRPIAAMTVFGILTATIGGFGSIFNLVVTSQIRGYNRISVFLAFFCIFTALWAIDRFLAERRRSIRLLHLSYALLPFAWPVLFLSRALDLRCRAAVDRLRGWLWPRTVAASWIVWGGVLAIGFLDQTPWTWFTKEIVKTIDEQSRRFHADAHFFAKIERSMPPGAKVFCLPYVQFPETPPVYKMTEYEHIRGYLHTRTLAWSCGAIKGRESDAWQQDVSFQKADVLLQRIVCRGFDGLFIDKRGFPTVNGVNKALTLITEINTLYGNMPANGPNGQKTRNARLPEIVHDDEELPMEERGQQFFLDLRPYREAFQANFPALYESLVQKEREWPAVTWLGVFYCPDPMVENAIRYGPPDASVWIVNPADRTRRFVITVTFCPLASGSFKMQLSGVINDEFALDKKAAEYDPRKEGIERRYVVEVPPGRQVLCRIRCTAPSVFIPTDVRRLCYLIKDFKIEEQK